MSIISDPKQFNPLQPEWGGEETEEKPPEALKSIVAIGASAGGLEALQRWFDSVPNDTGAAFVVIQHLAPDYKSIMDKLLERHTSMPTNVVYSSMLIEPNQIYLIAPGKEMTLEGSHIVPVARNSNTRLHLPINHFFRSIAYNMRFKSIGVILSGTGSDGCLGIKAIHESGGLVMVQSPEDSQFNGMPVNAIATGVVDLVASIEELTVTVVNFLKNPGFSGGTLMNGMHNSAVQEICWLLLEETGIDFSVYKLSTFSRRLENRMNINQLSSLMDYLELLKDKTGGELKRLQQDLFIGVTEFFRDSTSYDSLRKEVLEKLIKEKPESEPLRIWCIGCSTGEEAYSIAIICHDLMEQMGKVLDVKIFATDADMRALNKAMKGVYPESISTEVSESYLSNHFMKETPTIYRIRKHIRNMVVFAKHDILKDPPFSSTDLVTCRNLLIYFQTAGQQKAFNAVRFSLNHNGYLFLGKAETPTHPDNVFECVDYRAKIYQKVSAQNEKIMLTRQSEKHQPQEAKPRDLMTHSGDYERKSAAGNKAILLSHVAELLFDRFLAATVIVDAHLEVIHSYGDLSEWMLPHRPGRTQNKVSDLFISSTASYLMSALNQSIKTKKEVIFNHLSGSGTAENFEYSIHVIPFHHYSNPTTDSDLLHVITLARNDLVPARLPEPDAEVGSVRLPEGEATKKRLEYLEDEVKNLRERLRTSQAQLNSASEQLQTSNEELMASNEELQGTNEELQAVNEELYTLNSEYQQKINELMVATNDIDNFMKSTGIAAIFLDKAYRIRRYTSPFSDYINILPVDVNRSFLDLKLPFSFENLEHHLEQCALTGESHSRRVHLPDDRVALFKVVPYLNSYRQIDGVVLMIDEVKELTTAMRDIEIIRFESEQLYHMSDTISWNYDLELKQLHFSHTFHGKPLLIVDKPDLNSLFELVTPNYRDEFIEKLKQILIDGKEYQFEHTIQLADKSIHHIRSKVFSHSDKSGRVLKLFGLMKDFSARKQLEDQTLYLEAKFNTLFNSIPIPLTIVNDQGEYVYANPASLHLLGYTKEEITQLTYRDLIHPDDLVVSDAAFDHAKKTNQGSLTTNRRYVTKDGKSIEAHVKSFTLPHHEFYRDGFGVSMILPFSEFLDIAWKEEAVAIKSATLLDSNDQ